MVEKKKTPAELTHELFGTGPLDEKVETLDEVYGSPTTMEEVEAQGLTVEPVVSEPKKVIWPPKVSITPANEKTEIYGIPLDTASQILSHEAVADLLVFEASGKNATILAPITPVQAKALVEKLTEGFAAIQKKSVLMKLYDGNADQEHTDGPVDETSPLYVSEDNWELEQDQEYTDESDNGNPPGESPVKGFLESAMLAEAGKMQSIIHDSILKKSGQPFDFFGDVHYDKSTGSGTNWGFPNQSKKKFYDTVKTKIVEGYVTWLNSGGSGKKVSTGDVDVLLQNIDILTGWVALDVLDGQADHVFFFMSTGSKHVTTLACSVCGPYNGESMYKEEPAPVTVTPDVMGIVGIDHAKIKAKVMEGLTSAQVDFTTVGNMLVAAYNTWLKNPLLNPPAAAIQEMIINIKSLQAWVISDIVKGDTDHLFEVMLANIKSSNPTHVFKVGVPLSDTHIGDNYEKLTHVEFEKLYQGQPVSDPEYEKIGTHLSMMYDAWLVGGGTEEDLPSAEIAKLIDNLETVKPFIVQAVEQGGAENVIIALAEEWKVNKSLLYAYTGTMKLAESVESAASEADESVLTIEKLDHMVKLIKESSGLGTIPQALVFGTHKGSPEFPIDYVSGSEAKQYPGLQSFFTVKAKITDLPELKAPIKSHTHLLDGKRQRCSNDSCPVGS